MATVSKDSIAQFWLHAFPVSSRCDCSSFSDSTIVQNLLQFVSDNNSEKKIFDLINSYIQETKPRKTLKTSDIQISPKRRRSTKNTLTNITTDRLRFMVQIEVLEDIGNDEEVITAVPDLKIEDRTIENLTSILLETDSKIISQRFQRLVYPWLVDLSFTIPNDVFSSIIELMNKFPEDFFLHCFVPWLDLSGTENLKQFLSNLFTQLLQGSDRCKLCTYLCENSTSPFNDQQLAILSKWFDSKEFYFSTDLLNLLPNKIAISATTYSDDLPFAKVLHKVLIKCTENNQTISHEQRLALKQAITINTTILNDILLDLLD